MEDVRITKTKQMLRLKLIESLDEMPFEKISVSNLCRKAFTSRVTFYTYYDDKFDLIDDMMENYYNEAVGYYHALMNDREYQTDIFGGYNCLILSILKLYDMNAEFFKHVSASVNPYLYSAFYKLVYNSVAKYIDEHHEKLIARFPADETAALLCGGLWAVIEKCYAGDMKRNESRDRIISMYETLLQSQLFTFAG